VAEHLTDEQQEEQVKQWIKDNWFSIAAGLALGFAGLFGWQYYQKTQQQYNAEASAVYSQLTDALQKTDKDTTKATAEKLLTDFRDTAYAEFAALARAKVAIEEGDAEQAQTQYEWVISNSKQAAVKNVARLRLGRLLLAEGKLDNAITLIPSEDNAFNAEFAELKGDLMLAKGDANAARDAYAKALAIMPVDAQERLNVQQKLDDLAQPADESNEATS